MPLFWLKFLPGILFLAYALSDTTSSTDDYISRMSRLFNMRIPQTAEEYDLLYFQVMLRYRGKCNSKLEFQSFIKTLGIEDIGDKMEQWFLIFAKLQRDYDHLEPLLIAAKLCIVPQNKWQWNKVIDFMKNLEPNIYDAMLKTKIRKILDAKMFNSSSYQTNFNKLAYCFRQIPNNKNHGLLLACGFDREPENYTVAFFKLADSYTKLLPICKRLRCAGNLRYGCELFTLLYYAEDNHMTETMMLMASFHRNETTRSTRLQNFASQLSSLAAENNETAFVRQWDTVWKQQFEMFEKVADTSSASIPTWRTLKEAILRIWLAKDSSEALKFWKEDRNIWVNLKCSDGDFSEDDFQTLQLLSEIPSDFLRGTAIHIPGVDSSLINFAVALYKSGLKNNERYRKCLWVLMKTRDDEYDTRIGRIRRELKSSWTSIPDEGRRNHLFCKNFEDIWTLSSNAVFYGVDIKISGLQCAAEITDYQLYLMSLGRKFTSNAMDVASIIFREFYPAKAANLDQLCPRLE